MKVKPFGVKDIFRIVITLIIVILVGVFVAPRAQWVLILSIFVLVYVLILEFIKYYLGMRYLKKKKYQLPPNLT